MLLAYYADVFLNPSFGFSARDWMGGWIQSRRAWETSLPLAFSDTCTNYHQHFSLSHSMMP